jgi:hypothetical protein
MLLEFLCPLMGEGVMTCRSLPLRPSDDEGGLGLASGAMAIAVRP